MSAREAAVELQKSSTPDMVLVLGLPFHRTTLPEALTDALNCLEDPDPQYWVTPNMDFARQAYHDADLRDILFFAHRALCDGMPITWISKLIGAPIPQRVAGSDLVLQLFKATHKRPIKFFFFGSDQNTLEKAKEILESTYPQLSVVGSISPPHAAISEWDNRAYCKQIADAKPDILLVALGCPKQERWMVSYYRDAGAPLTMGVGASLDFITGRQVRAPKLMQKMGLEWLWRLSTNPSRLAKRYSKDLFYLIWVGGKQIRLMRRKLRRPEIPNNGEALPTLDATTDYTQITWSGEVERSKAQDIEQPQSWGKAVVCLCQDVTFIDSTGLGLMASIARNARKQGVPFVLLRPSQVIVDLLKSMRLERQIPWFQSTEELIAHLEHRNESIIGSRYLLDQKTVVITPSYAIEREHADRFENTLAERLDSLDRFWCVRIDLKDVEFIDSYGISKLVALKRKAQNAGIQLWTENHQAHVLHTLQILRIEKMFIQTS